MIRLGINVDHVATVRQARREAYPDPVHAAVLAELGGADNITCHLREDRRHIQDHDVFRLKDTIKIPLNLEMAATPEMIALAHKVKPHAITLVPEKREELTTEGGLDVARLKEALSDAVAALKDSGALVSLFIKADRKTVDICKEIGAHAVEFHTGGFCRAIDEARSTSEKLSLVRSLDQVATHAYDLGVQAHFGHGLHYGNAAFLQLIRHAEEANIGHSVVAHALFVGFKEAVAKMKALLGDGAHKPWTPQP